MNTGSDDRGNNLVAQACADARDLLSRRATLHEILTILVTAAEEMSGDGAVSSVLVLDTEGLLRNGASPNLPRDYLDAIDRLKPRADLGTCASAAATGQIVVTPSFLADGKWNELRHLPLALGFAGAWSMPIKSRADGRVLGTFGTYFREIRSPSAAEISAVSSLAATAGTAIDALRA